MLLMLDTETVTNKRLPYDVCFTVFSDGGNISTEHHFFIRECLQYVLRYTAKHGRPPLYWPDRINPALLIKAKNCISALDCIEKFNTVSQNVHAIVAHNVSFDISAMRNMSEKWAENMPIFVAETIELSGFFPDFLPKEYGTQVPYTKTGLATFKADFFMPVLGGLTQGHDAKGDVRNQIAIWRRVCMSEYSGKKTIFHNMLAYQKAKHDDIRFIGIGFIPGS